MSYESAPELSAFFKRMGVPLEVVDEPAMGKFVKATADIFPGVVEEGKPNAGQQLDYAELFEESGIASWATSDLILALAKNHGLLVGGGGGEKEKNQKDSPNDALIGYCNECLSLRYVDGKDGKASSTFATLVADTLLGTDEESTGVVATTASPSSSTPATTTTFLYCSEEAQQNDTMAAAILGPRGALRALRKYHAELEKKAASLEQQMIPISVETISRCIVTAVVRFLRSLERSVRAQFNAQSPTMPTDKKVALLRDLMSCVVAAQQQQVAAASDAKDKKDQRAPNPFITSLFEGSVRAFNRLVEPPEGSEFEASVKTKEWCRTIRNAIQKNVTDVVRSVASALICEMAAGDSSASYGLQLAAGSLVGAPTSATDVNDELAAVISVLPTSAVKTLTLQSPLSTTAKPIVAVDQLEAMLEWVPLVVQGWFNDATIITLLGQTTINAQALTAVSAATGEAGVGGCANANNLAAVEVVQVARRANDDDEKNAADEDSEEYDCSRFTMITQKNIHQTVPIFGAAVYTLQSCFNHSCAPNAEVVPTLPCGLGGHDIIIQAIPKDKKISSKGKVGGAGGGDDSGAEDGAADAEASASTSTKTEKKEKKDKPSDKKEKKEKVKPLIKEGEEINITYIPMLYLALEDYTARRQRLESYFFVCECKRCFRENAKAEKAEAKKKTKEAKNADKQ